MPRRKRASLEGQTGVLLSLWFLLPSIIVLGSPHVTIDGLFPMKMGWGSEFVPLAPGAHEATCHVHFFRALNTGEGRCQFEVPEHTVVKLRWFAPLWMTGRGWWKNAGPLPGP